MSLTTIPRQFGTRSLLVVTAIAGSAICIVTCSIFQSLDSIAQNLAIFYFNFLVFILLTGVLASLYQFAGVIIGVLLSVALSSAMLWMICVWDGNYLRYVGIQLFLLIVIAYAFLSNCSRPQPEIDLQASADPKFHSQLKEALDRKRSDS